MLFTDSHCHLASHKFPAEEIDALLLRAKENNIHRMVTLATSLEDIPHNIALTEQHDNVFSALGIHPCDVHQTPEDFLSQLRDYAQHPKCVAIGETGLDYFHPAPDGWTDEAYHQRQRDFLRQHFELAKELGKNIIIHTRARAGKQSMDDALDIYADFSDDVTAVFHCFLGPWENATRIIELGGIVSFTGITTFKSAKDCIAAAIAAPSGKFMVETDAPYLSPTPHRGKRNEPAFTAHTAKAIATARGELFSDFFAHTEATANKFFKLSPTS